MSKACFEVHRGCEAGYTKPIVDLHKEVKDLRDELAVVKTK